jgi:hypothetical protein
VLQIMGTTLQDMQPACWVKGLPEFLEFYVQAGKHRLGPGPCQALAVKMLLPE